MNTGEQSEPHDAAHVARTDASERLQSKYGWIIESSESGGVRMRMSAAARGCMLGCSCGILFLLCLFAAWMYYVGGRGWLPGGKSWERLPGDGFWRVAEVCFWLTLVGIIGLAVVAMVLQILWFLLVREEWEAGTNRLVVRRRVLGRPWKDRQYQNGTLLIEANYHGKKEPSWELGLKCSGEKHYLIREKAISDRAGFESSRQEVEAVADMLAQHTGWRVISAQSEAAEAAETSAPRAELPAELLKARFRAAIDERLRLTIRPPTRRQLLFGLVLVVLGCGWTTLLASGVASAFQTADIVERPLVNLPFLFVMVLLPMLGAGAAGLGVVMIFSRERWILDRNLLLIRSRLFGWRSERAYMDGAFHLAHICIRSEDGDVWTWQLQLQNEAGQVLRVLRRDQDDGLPRLLGAVLSERTGWPLREAET